jgi:hypothetical protein
MMSLGGLNAMTGRRGCFCALPGAIESFSTCWLSYAENVQLLSGKETINIPTVAQRSGGVIGDCGDESPMVNATPPDPSAALG